MNKSNQNTMPSSPRNSQDIGSLLVQVTQTTADVIFLIVQILITIIISLGRLIIPKQPKSVRGEIVLVTGAGHGIGKELALLYASEGATVVIWDINEHGGKETVKEIIQRGYPKAYFFLCDVSNHDNVQSCANEVQEKVGQVTILINNAGIMPTHPILEHTKEEIERIININVMAHFWTIKAFLPSMKRNNYGHIVALSSTAGLYGVPNLVPYCCSKFAVRGLMESLFQECRTDLKNEVRFTSVYPYIVDTGLCKNPKIRFPSLMPIVTPQVAAKSIMRGQRLHMKEVAVPQDFYYLQILLRLFPMKAQDLFMDFVSVQLDSDLS